MSAAVGPAERITRGAGTRIAFARDDTRNTDIVEVVRRGRVTRRDTEVAASASERQAWVSQPLGSL